MKLFSEMGLSSKQISGDGFDWCKTLQIPSSPPPTMVIGRQQNQSEPLNCPRCDSANTKFCYYNNYNKSQPRHFCRACKRHWTKGGTLRNVPVGGGRKNKRLKKSSSSSGRRMITDQITVQIHNQRQNFPLLSHGDRKNSSELPHQGILRPPASPLVQNSFNSGNLDGINYRIDQHGLFVGSDSLPSCSFLSSSSLYQSSGIYNYSQDQVKTIHRKTTLSVTHPTHLSSNTSSVMEDMANYWNWEDMNSLVATDLNLCWDDSDL